jgi:hypothetical protein
MVRSAIAVLVGYVAITLVGAALFTGAYFVVGTEAALSPTRFGISVLMAAYGLAASFAGGLARGLGVPEDVSAAKNARRADSPL